MGLGALVTKGALRVHAVVVLARPLYRRLGCGESEEVHVVTGNIGVSYGLASSFGNDEPTLGAMVNLPVAIVVEVVPACSNRQCHLVLRGAITHSKLSNRRSRTDGHHQRDEC